MATKDVLDNTAGAGLPCVAGVRGRFALFVVGAAGARRES